MNGLIDGADRVFWWLKQRPAAAGGIGVVIVGVIVALLVLGGDEKSGKAIPDSAVAAVAGKPITNASLAHWVSVYTSANTGAAKPTTAQARTAAFELLAGSAWIEKEAERQKVVVTPAEASKATNDYLTQAATSTKLSRAALLKQLGTNLTDLNFQQRVSLLAGKLQEKIVKALPAPTAAAISKAYTEDAQLWAKPSQRTVDVIIAETQAKANAARQALANGSTFAEVNQKYSSNSTLSGSGGAIQDLTPGSTDPEVERPIFSAVEGRLTGPVKAGTGFMVFKVSKVTAQPEQTLAQATPKIKANLTAIAQNKATNGFLTELRKRWKPQTKCRSTITSAEYCGASA
ncbi:hypothetical protein DSM112329_01817 [Paraconexibacter sp. AEG42_29]|uniref:peptidylprolyl isomerase n=1 Tax=Paraconexibacter sp. AEG42_29 TaxID=2997339 RepID=A0AAU7ATQ4_9ACTN